MSLQVYNKTDPPMSVIVDNDTYFDGHTELDSGDTCAGVLKVIDKAVYKQHLSTGTKTLLNVYIPNTFMFSPGLTSDNIDIVWDGKHFTKLSELKRYLWGDVKYSPGTLLVEEL